MESWNDGMIEQFKDRATVTAKELIHSFKNRWRQEEQKGITPRGRHERRIERWTELVERWTELGKSKTLGIN